MTIERGISLIFVHIGGLTQSQILDMEYPFYKDVIQELYIKLNYGTAQHLMGRDYSDEKTIKYIEEQNPFKINLEEKSNKSEGKRVTLGFLKSIGMTEK